MALGAAVCFVIKFLAAAVAVKSEFNSSTGAKPSARLLLLKGGRVPEENTEGPALRLRAARYASRREVARVEGTMLRAPPEGRSRAIPTQPLSGVCASRIEVARRRWPQ